MDQSKQTYIYYQLKASACQDINECLRELKIAEMQSFRSELGYQIKEKTAWPWAIHFLLLALNIMIIILYLFFEIIQSET